MNTRLYQIWADMKQRCGKKKWYEEISYTSEWEKFKPFEKWALENGYDDTLSIDRIDSKGNYEPDNCRFTTMKTQQRNKSNNKIIKYNGKSQCLADWCDELGLNKHTLGKRLLRGWSIEEAFQKQSNKKPRSPRNKDEKGRFT